MYSHSYPYYQHIEHELKHNISTAISGDAMQLEKAEFVIPDHVTWKNLDKGFVLLDLNSSNYYTLNETASFIWQTILDEKRPEDIPTLMTQAYECSEDECRKDIQDQLDYLLEENLIRIKR